MEQESIGLNAARESYTVGRYAHYRVGEDGELRDFDRLGVGSENNVLVMHLDPGSEEIASRVAKVHAVHDRYSRVVHFRTVDPESLSELAWLAPVKRSNQARSSVGSSGR